MKFRCVRYPLSAALFINPTLIARIRSSSEITRRRGSAKDLADADRRARINSVTQSAAYLRNRESSHVGLASHLNTRHSEASRGLFEIR